MKHLDRRQHCPLILNALLDLFTKSLPYRCEVLSTRGTITVQQIECNLRVEHRLPDRLKGQQLTGLALEFFDSGSSSLRDRPKESNVQLFQSDRL